MSKEKVFQPIDNDKLFNVLYENNLAWEPQKRPDYTLQGDQFVEVPGSFSIFKGETTQRLAGVGPDYKILPNRQFVELALQVAHYFDLDTMPTFKQYSRKYNKQDAIEGGVVRAIIPFSKFRPTSKNVGDVVDINIILTNSHDGSTGLQWGLYTKVLSCSNGMTYTDKMYQKSVRHLSNMQAVFEDSIAAFGELGKLAKNIESDITRMTSVGITKDDIQKTIQKVCGINEKEKRSKIVSQRKYNIVEKFTQVLLEEIKEKGATKWALPNAATKWVTHGSFSELSKDTGAGAKISNEVYKMALEASTNPGGTSPILQEEKVPVLIDQFQMSLQN